MRIEQEVQLDFKDVLIRPMRSNIKTRAEVDLNRTFKFPNSGRTWTGVPIVVSNMDCIGTLETFSRTCHFGIITALHKFYKIADLAGFFGYKAHELLKIKAFPDYVMYTMGTRAEDMEKLREVVKLNLHQYFNFVLIDVPNGYLHTLKETCLRVRQLLPGHVLMAGNVVTPDVVSDLINLAGVDIVKVGIGSGAACLTRSVTGVGRPQLSTVIDCADYAHQHGGMVCSDGGIVNTGDFSKAFVAGADFVMAGSIFAQYSPSKELIPYFDDSGHKVWRRVIKYRGMSSKDAMIDHYGEMAEHRAPEGKVVELEWLGEIEDRVKEVFGGIRSACTYIGATRLKDMNKKGTFYRVTQQLNESRGVFTP